MMANSKDVVKGVFKKKHLIGLHAWQESLNPQNSKLDAGEAKNTCNGHVTSQQLLQAETERALCF